MTPPSMNHAQDMVASIGETNQKPIILGWWLVETSLWFATLIVEIVMFWHLDSTKLLLLKVIGLVLMTLCSAIGFFYSIPTRLQERANKLHFFEDIRRFILVGLITVNVLAIMIVGEIMIDPTSLAKFWEAWMEWPIAFGTVIGVLGAGWAVLAKIDAHRAFRAAEKAVLNALQAHESAQGAVKEAIKAQQSSAEAVKQAISAKEFSEKTYRSVAGSFSFRDILTRSDFMLGYHLFREELIELTLFLGPPAVGMFYKEGDKFNLFEESLSFCSDLANYFEKLNDSRTCPQDLRIKMVTFSQNKTNTYLHALEETKKTDYKERESRLFNICAKLQSKYNDGFKYSFVTEDKGLRFAISKSRKPGEDEKAIVWLVSGFTPENPVEFLSGGFKTKDEEIVKVLMKFCDDHIKRNNAAATVAPVPSGSTPPITTEQPITDTRSPLDSNISGELSGEKVETGPKAEIPPTSQDGSK